MDLSDFPQKLRILRYLNRYDNVIVSRVSKDLDITNSHVQKIFMCLYRDGLVSFKRSGRSKFVSLTAKGKLDAVDIDNVMSRHDLKVMFQRGV